MISSKSHNYLNIPLNHFGMHGIETGNLVYKAIETEESEYKVQYDSVNQRIIILGSSNLLPDVIDNILYAENMSSSYCTWFPKIKKKRDSDGNLLIKFSTFHPHNTELSSFCSKKKMRSEKTIMQIQV